MIQVFEVLGFLQVTTTFAVFTAMAIMGIMKLLWDFINGPVLEENHGNMDMLVRVMEIRGFLENHIVIVESEI